MKTLLPALMIAVLPMQAAASPQDICMVFASTNLTNVMHQPMDRPAPPIHGFGDYSVPVASCKEAVTAHPGDPALRLQYARALIADVQFEQAKKVLLPLVDKKQPIAMRLYGALTFGDHGLDPVELAKSVGYYKEAADLGDPVAALLYAEWLRQTYQPEEVYGKWYILAATDGYAPAEFFLYSLSMQGMISGVSKSVQLAFLQDSARKGFVWAMIQLAERLRDGTLPPDPTRARALEDAVRKIQPESGLGLEEYDYQFG